MLFNFSPMLAIGTLASVAILAAGSLTHLGSVLSPWYTKRQIDCISQYERCTFLYFSNRDENIHLTASNGNDALFFTELNNGHLILKSTDGDDGVCDPLMMRSPTGDKFYSLSKDSCIACGTSWGGAQSFGSRYLEVWESKDLITWSYIPTLCTGRPASIKARPILSTILSSTGEWSRLPRKTFKLPEKSYNLTAGLSDWARIASCLDKSAGTKVEGPSIFKANCQDVNGPGYIILTDEFGGNSYVPLESPDLANGR